MLPENMSLRLELFVRDMELAIDFYTRILRFVVLRREREYASLQNGSFILGLGPIDKLSDDSDSHYFTRSKLSGDRGLGVEIVLEVDDVQAYYEHVQSCGYPIKEPLQERNWGLTDFRIVDPDGYYLRLTSRA
jgi:catechol 2,3-dioxygenase-like lactoylglutathione lyase family enzyme